MAVIVQKIVGPTLVLEGRRMRKGIFSNSRSVTITPTTSGAVTKFPLGTQITNYDDVYQFYGDVKLKINTIQSMYSYGLSPDANLDDVNLKQYQGSKLVKTSQTNMVYVNQHAEVYITFNGKDPRRTKEYLWQNYPIITTNAKTNPSNPAPAIWDTSYMTLKHNKTGTTKTLIKARVYFEGHASDVVSVTINIVRPDSRRF